MAIEWCKQGRLLLFLSDKGSNAVIGDYVDAADIATVPMH